MKTKKVLAIVLAAVMVLGLAACSKPKDDPKPQESLLTEVKGVTIPAFEVEVCGVKVTNEMMADYPYYSASVESTNSSGTQSTVVYIGFKVNDMAEAAGLSGTAGKLTATADDGYAIEWENGGSENNMIAVSKDGNQFKSYPWFVPCDSKTTGDQLKGCAKIDIEGLSGGKQSSGESEKKDDAPLELKDPVAEDRTDKINFPDFSFKVNGQDVKNADLEGLTIWRITVTTQNSKGNISEAKYSGYALKDVLAKLGIANPASVKAVASDGYESEVSAEDLASELTIVAIEKDKETGENGTVWLAPCLQQSSGKYAKGVVEIKAE